MNETKSGAQRLGFMIPLILFVIFFIICCGVLSSVFAKSTDLSIRARQLNGAVQVCRNGAEIFASCGSAEETEKILGSSFFDENAVPTAQENAQMYLEVRQEPSRDGVQYAVLEVYSIEGEHLYTLTVASYLGG